MYLFDYNNCVADEFPLLFVQNMKKVKVTHLLQSDGLSIPITMAQVFAMCLYQSLGEKICEKNWSDFELYCLTMVLSTSWACL